MYKVSELAKNQKQKSDKREQFKCKIGKSTSSFAETLDRLIAPSTVRVLLAKSSTGYFVFYWPRERECLATAMWGAPEVDCFRGIDFIQRIRERGVPGLMTHLVNQLNAWQLQNGLQQKELVKKWPQSNGKTKDSTTYSDCKKRDTNPSFYFSFLYVFLVCCDLVHVVEFYF